MQTAPKHKSAKQEISLEKFRNRLKLKHIEASKRIREVHPRAYKFFRERGLDLGKIREHSAKIIGAGAIAGSLLLAPGEMKLLPAPHEIIEKLKIGASDNDIEYSSKKVLVDTLKSVLPKRVRPLERSEEKFLEGIFSQVLNVAAKASLEGEHLNTTYGYIGLEQHLKRFPGDRLSEHGSNLYAGMAPGLGAWGYFAPSKEELTRSLEETEKWYAVVQTLYLPDWGRRTAYLRDWYKYRKVLIVNVENGNAVVAAIADSGPAAWTGKHFGGSPEVMDALGGKSFRKGAVIVFFVDDPENRVSLGPVEYNKEVAMLGR